MTAPELRREFASQEEWEAYAQSVEEAATYRYGEWTFCPRLGMAGGKHLTTREVDILRLLCDSAPLPLRSYEIARALEETYEGQIAPTEVKVFVRRLRGKIGRGRIVVVAGRGYVFVPFPED